MCVSARVYEGLRERERVCVERGIEKERGREGESESDRADVSSMRCVAGTDATEREVSQVKLFLV